MTNAAHPRSIYLMTRQAQIKPQAIDQSPDEMRVAATTAMLLVVIVLGLPSLIYPFGFDQSNQAFAAAAILDGYKPFSEVPSLKPPLTLAFHALAIKLFGQNMTSIRMLELIWVLATAMAIASCVRKAWTGSSRTGTFAAVLGGILYAHYHYSLNYWHTAQTDGWMNLPLAVAFRLALSFLPSERPAIPSRSVMSFWTLIGLLCVIALLFKYTAISFLAFFCAWAIALLRSNKKSGSRAIIGLSIGVAGALLFLSATLWLWGVGEAFFYDHLTTAVTYSNLSGQNGGAAAEPLALKILYRLANVEMMHWFALRAPPTLLIGVTGVMLSLVFLFFSTISRRSKLSALILLGWTASAWASTAVQGRFFGYHFLPLLPPLAIGGSLLVATCIEAFKISAHRKLIAFGLTSLSVGILLASPLRTYMPPFVSAAMQLNLVRLAVSEKMALDDIWASGAFEIAPNYSVAETVLLVEEIQNLSSPEDSLFIWGTNRTPYFLTQRPRVSLIATSLEATGSDVVVGSSRGTARLLSDMERHPPDWALVQHGDAIPHVLGHNKDSSELLKETPEIQTFLKDHYSFKRRVARFDILEYDSSRAPRK